MLKKNQKYLVIRLLRIFFRKTKQQNFAMHMSNYIYENHYDTSKTFTVATHGGKQGIISVCGPECEW